MFPVRFAAATLAAVALSACTVESSSEPAPSAPKAKTVVFQVEGMT